MSSKAQGSFGVGTKQKSLGVPQLEQSESGSVCHADGRAWSLGCVLGVSCDALSARGMQVPKLGRLNSRSLSASASCSETVYHIESVDRPSTSWLNRAGRDVIEYKQ